MLDVNSQQIINDVTILINGDKIGTINPSEIGNDYEIIDLGDATLLPGLIDLHTHVLMASSEQNQDDLQKKTPIFRALRATTHLRIALQNGITTIRDVSSEGALYADVDLKIAVENDYVVGPRMFASSTPIAGTGQGPPFGRYQQVYNFNSPVQFKGVTGVDECRKAVREHFSKGVDFIKVYVDWDRVTLTDEELEVIVDEANRLGLKVAAHAGTTQGVEVAAKAKVHSIEHGSFISEQAINLMIKNQIVLVPTLTVISHAAKDYPKYQEEVYRNVKKAYEQGVMIAMGTDAGSFPWMELPQSRELVLYVQKLGMNPWRAIKCGTQIPAKFLGIEEMVGSINEGKLADIIAVDGNPIDNIESLEEVKFVMKSGKVQRDTINK